MNRLFTLTRAPEQRDIDFFHYFVDTYSKAGLALENQHALAGYKRKLIGQLTARTRDRIYEKNGLNLSKMSWKAIHDGCEKTVSTGLKAPTAQSSHMASMETKGDPHHAAPDECYNCGERSHFVRECPQSK